MHRFPRIFLRTLAALPLPLLHALGTVLGWITYGTSPTYRRHLRENLEQAGYRDAATRRAAIAAAGHLVMETPAIWLRPQAEVAALVRAEHGFDALVAARAQGKALLLLTPHLGCFEITAQLIARRFPITVLYREPKMRWLGPLMREGRDRGDMRLEPADLRGVRALLAALKRGETVGVLPDQVPGQGEGAWADFFGRRAYTGTFVPRLAQREGIACFMVYARRLPRGAGYAMTYRAYPDRLPQEEPARRLNRALEEAVRECPGQYLWGYNRYKTPAGVEPA